MAWAFSTVLIVVAIILAIWYFNLTEHTRKIKWTVIVLVAVLIYLAVGNVVITERVDMSSPGGILRGVVTYSTWVFQVLMEAWDIGATTTGRVIEVVNDTVK